MRSIRLFLALTLALVSSSSLLFAAGQTGNLLAGLASRDTVTHQPNGGTNGYDVNGNSVAADPRDNEAAYYFDGDEIRRYDFEDATDAPLFDVPALDQADAPGGFSNIQDNVAMTTEVWGAFLRFDPSNPDRLIFGESSGRSVREYMIDTTDRTMVTNSRTIYQTMVGDDWSPFDAAFLSTGELVISRGGSVGGNSFNRLTVVDASTTPSTLIDILETPGFSGPCAVDNDGALYYLVPQNTTGLTTADQLKLLSWTPAQIAAAIADPVADPLTAVNAVTERDDDYPAFTFSTNMVARIEDNERIVYLVTYSGGISRLNLDDAAGDLVIVQGANSSNFNSIAFSSPSAHIEPNVGLNHNGLATARIYVLTSIFNAFNDQPSCLTQIVSDTPLTGVNDQMTNLTASPLSAEPYDGTPSTTFSLTITLRDENGTPITTGTAANATFAIEVFVNNNGMAGAGAAFASGVTSVNAQSGVIAFSGLSIANAGNYILRVRDLASTLVLESEFNIVELGSIAHVQSVPANPALNTAFSIQIELRDQNGMRITDGALASSILSLTNVAGPGTLSGNNFAQASNGLATFTNLSVNATGVYTFTFASDGGSVGAGTQIDVVLTAVAATTPNASSSSKGGSGGCALVGSGSQGLWMLGLAMALFGVTMLRRRAA